jgi:hypothetical protein
MENDPRCCGSGTCIIDPNGLCWCGQTWDGTKMVRPPLEYTTPQSAAQFVDPLPTPQTPPESKQTRS